MQQLRLLRDAAAEGPLAAARDAELLAGIDAIHRRFPSPTP
jgi:hypothetical protein